MLNAKLRLWCAAALLALGAQIGATLDRSDEAAGTPIVPTVGADAAEGQPAAMTVRRRWVSSGAIDPLGTPSPDGRYLSCTDWGTGDLALLELATGAVRRLTRKSAPHEFAEFSVISPDGSQIAYAWFNQDGVYDLRVIRLDGGGPRVLVSEAEMRHVQPHAWSPDGRHLLFGSDRTGSAAAWIVAIAGGKPEGPPERVKPELGQSYPLGFSRNGCFYYVLESVITDVYTATLDLTEGKVVTPPRPVNERALGGKTSPAWSPDGRYLSYLMEQRSGASEWATRTICIQSSQTGEIRPLPRAHGYVNWPVWSPDGRSLLATGHHPRNGRGLHRIEVRTGRVTTLVPDGSERFLKSPVCSPDGKAVYFEDRRSGDPPLIRRDLRTGGERKLLEAPIGAVRGLALSPDGCQLAVITRDRALNSLAIKIVPAAGGAARELFREEGASEITTAAWSADGSQLLFARRRGNSTELWRIPAAGGEPRPTGLAMPGLNTLSVIPRPALRVPMRSGRTCGAGSGRRRCGGRSPPAGSSAFRRSWRSAGNWPASPRRRWGASGTRRRAGRSGWRS